MSEKPERLTPAVGLLLVLASILWGALNLGDTLDVPRVTPQGPPGVSASESLRYASRLWQDPFEHLVYRTPGARGTNSDSGLPSGTGKPLSEQITNRANPVTILGVTLEAMHYPEDAEVRRRLRYAVEVALLTSKFAPEDRNHIGIQELKIPENTGTAAATNTASDPVRGVAFEWFISTQSSAPHSVLVVWLKEDDLAPDPLAALGGLARALGMTETGRTNVSFTLLGPRSSDTLRAMANGPTNETLRALGEADRFRIVSPEATAPESFIVSGRSESSRPDDIRAWTREALGKRLGSAKAFENWIATDDRLAKRLIEELANRAAGSSRSNVIAIVSEADTFYGRAMPITLGEALTNHEVLGKNSAVWQFNYLRGLDGGKSQPPDAGEKDSKATTTPEAALEAGLKGRRSERSEGDAQKDYAERFAAFLEREDAELRARGSRCLAVGLTGSDVYDKLLLLHALRRHLPEAVFFTTDLDSRYWAAQELRYTRSLLVASAYGLEPSPMKGTGHLPFRDAYQSAVFAAARAVATRARGGADATPQSEDLEGRLFEIGRHGPVLLSMRPESLAGRIRARDAWRGTTARLALFLGILYAIVVVLARLNPPLPAGPGSASGTSPGAFSAKPPLVRWRVIAAWGGVATFLVLAGLSAACWVAGQPGQEPWIFTSGVSIWPTEVLRLLCALLCFGFLVGAAYQHRARRRELWQGFLSREDFEVCLRATRDRFAPRRPRTIREWWDRYRGTWLHSWTPVDPPTGRKEPGGAVRDLFEAFVWRGLAVHRYLRVMPLVLAYSAVMLGLVFLTGGFPDRLCIRGGASRSFDLWLLAVTVLGFLVVLFYSLDAARLTGRLLEGLAPGASNWPSWLTNEWAAKLSVRPEDLDGWLDVRFAAEKTRETRRLMTYPFAIFLLLLLSRNAIFERWTWPTGLIVVFVLNFVLAAVCWGFVRNSARRVRARALNAIDRNARQVAAGFRELIITPGPPEPSGSGGSGTTHCRYSREAYVRRLADLRAEVENEQRGAFARGIQDPTYVALFLPTGVTGILSVLFYYWFYRS